MKKMSLRTAPSRSRCRGITFTEVMFAAILLGIGFIMVAGLFSVAGQQTIQSIEESNGAALAEAAQQFLRQTADDPAWIETCPFDSSANTQRMLSQIPTVQNLGQVPVARWLPLPDAIWARVCGDAISGKDPRFAWTALYSLRKGDQYANVIIIVLQARNKQRFDVLDVVRPPATSALPGVLDPKPVIVTALACNKMPLTNAGVSIITFAPGDNQNFNPSNNPGRTPVTEGAFVIIAGDANGNPCPQAGRVYRLGRQVSPNDPTRWELVPGYDGANDPAENIGGSFSGAMRAYVLGKGYIPGTTEAPFGGYAMDIAAYPTSILVKSK